MSRSLVHLASFGLSPVLSACGLQAPSNEALILDTAPVYDETCVVRDMPDEPPPCHCDALMPLCVGAWWDYLEKDLDSGELSDKRQEIEGFGDPGFEEYGKSGFDAFYYERESEGETKQSWITVSDGEVCWQFDRWYFDDVLTKTRIYEPGRLRIDQRRLLPGDDWRERFTETIHEGGASDVSVIELAWSVSGMASLSTQVGGHRIEYEDLVCQERVAVGQGSEDDPEHKQFCFVRGIGKVYEWDMTEHKEEFLVDYQLPDCTD